MIFLCNGRPRYQLCDSMMNASFWRKLRILIEGIPSSHCHEEGSLNERESPISKRGDLGTLLAIGVWTHDDGIEGEPIWFLRFGWYLCEVLQGCTSS